MSKKLLRLCVTLALLSSVPTSSMCMQDSYEDQMEAHKIKIAKCTNRNLPAFNPFPQSFFSGRENNTCFSQNIDWSAVNNPIISKQADLYQMPICSNCRSHLREYISIKAKKEEEQKQLRQVERESNSLKSGLKEEEQEKKVERENKSLKAELKASKLKAENERLRQELAESERLRQELASQKSHLPTIKQQSIPGQRDLFSDYLQRPKVISERPQVSTSKKSSSSATQQQNSPFLVLPNIAQKRENRKSHPPTIQQQSAQRQNYLLQKYLDSYNYVEPSAGAQSKQISDPQELYQKGYEFYEKNDYASAKEYFKKAAEQGNAEAQYRMGHLYFYGEGVSQDFRKAKTWFEKAAVQGNEDARIKLRTLGVLTRLAEEEGKPLDNNTLVKLERMRSELKKRNK